MEYVNISEPVYVIFHHIHIIVSKWSNLLQWLITYLKT